MMKCIVVKEFVVGVRTYEKGEELIMANDKAMPFIKTGDIELLEYIKLKVYKTMKKI